MIKSLWRINKSLKRTIFSINMAAVDAPAEKRTKELIQPQPAKKRRKFEKQPVKQGSSEEIIKEDVKELLGECMMNEMAIKFEKMTETKEVEVDIVKLGSLGEGMAIIEENHVVLVPFTVPGDRVKARLYKRFETYSLADLVSVLLPSKDRNDSLIGCKYFAKCSGCQFQMIDYDLQLLHKKKVVERAFAVYPSVQRPEIQPTCASPLQYNYRTKITPHFDMPRKNRAEGFIPTIGFNEKGRRSVLDIETCPIATPILNVGLKEARQKVIADVSGYKRGATLLLRESTNDSCGSKTCVTDHKAIINEYVGQFRFQFPAGSFFQNNNSILALLTKHVREHVAFEGSRFLVDAYCGSGLFSVSCSHGFTQVIGVEVSADSVKYAQLNAKANNVLNTRFVLGRAENIFAEIEFPSDQTALIIDPPRKGCDHAFLDQLLAFLPKRIVYVSCNVHTQARDLHYLGKAYVIDSIRGFDLFPQTYHVESCAVLSRVD